MKNFLIALILINCLSLTCLAKENKITLQNKDYKIEKCNNTIDRCIVIYKYFKYGITDKIGNVYLPFEYDSILEAEYSNYIVRKNFKEGLVDKNGNTLIEAKYYTIRQEENNNLLRIQPTHDFLFGWANAKTGETVVKEGMSDDILQLKNGAYKISKNAKEGVLDKNFKLILPQEYYFIMLINGNKYYRLHKEIGGKDKFGIADLNGKIVVPVEYDWIDKNSLTNNYKVGKNGKTYIFNSKTGVLSEN